MKGLRISTAGFTQHDHKKGQDKRIGVAHKGTALDQLQILLKGKQSAFFGEFPEGLDTRAQVSIGEFDFVSYQENIDTSSPLGAAIFTIISAVAQLERDIIVERVRAGLRRARINGQTLGRPSGSNLDVNRIQGLRKAGLSLREIALKVKASKSSVARALQAS